MAAEAALQYKSDMTRLERIAPLISALPENLFEEFLAAAEHAARDETVYDRLSDFERAKIDEALKRLDNGEGVSYDLVKARLDAKLARSGA